MGKATRELLEALCVEVSRLLVYDVRGNCRHIVASRHLVAEASELLGLKKGTAEGGPVLTGDYGCFQEPHTCRICSGYAPAGVER